MSARTARLTIAAIFLALGGWALFAPYSVFELAFTPSYRPEGFPAAFLMSCFGAQACLFGLVTLFAHYPPRAFAALGAALLPFLVFDWYFSRVVPVLTTVGLLDLVGNIAMLILCAMGWKAARREARCPT